MVKWLKIKLIFLGGVFVPFQQKWQQTFFMINKMYENKNVYM